MNKEQLSKCAVCRKNDVACEYLPLMTSEEAAKLITLKEDLVNKKKLKLYRVGADCFILGKSEWEYNNKLYIDDVMFKKCPFYDHDEGCTVYDARPGICKDFAEHPALVCPFKNTTVEDMEKLDKNQLTFVFLQNQTFVNYIKERFGTINSELYSNLGNKNITKLPNYKGGRFKKLLKQNKENLLMFNIVNFIYGAFEAEGIAEKGHIEIPNLISARLKYKLLSENNRVTTIISRFYSTEITLLKPLMNVYNRLINKITLYPNDYLLLLYKKSTKLASVLDTKEDCIDNEIFDAKPRLQYLAWMFSSVLLLETWKLTYKNKAKDFQNLYNVTDMAGVKDYLAREIQIELGLEPTGWSFKLLLTDPFKCISDNMSDFYKRIILAG